jgi:hypothetical protein
MSKEREIDGFWGYAWRVIIKPWWFSAVFGVFITGFGVFCLVRDQFLPEDWQRKLATPHIAWRTWLSIILGAALTSVIRNGYEGWSDMREAADGYKKELERRISAPLPGTSPQVKLTGETTPELGAIQRFQLRNISATQAIYNIAFQPVRLKDTLFINWHPGTIDILEPNALIPIEPLVLVANNGVGNQYRNVASLHSILRNEDVKTEYDIGPVAFSCEDSVQNRYLVTFTVKLNNSGNIMSVQDCERIRIGSRPSQFVPERAAK